MTSIIERLSKSKKSDLKQSELGQSDPEQSDIGLNEQFVSNQTESNQTGSRMSVRTRTYVVVAGIVGCLVLMVFITAKSDRSVRDFDPQSREPNGYMALRMLVEQRGAETQSSDEIVAGAGSANNTYIVASDVISEFQSGYLRNAADSGATVIYMSPRLPLDLIDVEPVSSKDVDEDKRMITNCAEQIPALESVKSIRVSRFRITDAYLMSTDSADEFCFNGSAEVEHQDYAFITVENVGDGEIVTVGSPYVFSNNVLASDDNAALALALIAPSGNEKITFVTADSNVEGQELGLGGLIAIAPRWIKLSFWQIIAACAIGAYAFGRRTAPVVEEPQIVELNSNERVNALANMLRVAGQHNFAVSALKADLRRELVLALRLDPRTSDQDLVSGAVTTFNIDGKELHYLLTTPGVNDSNGVAAYARRCAELANVVRQKTVSTGRTYL